MVICTLRPNEIEFIDEIEEVGHGELYDVLLIPDGDPEIEIEVHESFWNFIKALRRERRFTRLVIHNGLPSYGEAQGKTEKGRRFLQKMKFN